MALVIAFAAFPYYSGPVADLLLSAGAAQATQQTPKVARVAFAVEGMYCPACAKAIENKLYALNGIREVSVSYEKGVAEIQYDAALISPEQIQKAIQDAGYHAHKT